MFGSDWPVSLRAGTYQITVDAVGELLAALTAPERAAVLGGTAVRTYTLS
jgi:L-fuconolactonase